ncbi:MAG: hypothetical protein H0X17_21160 [Deltaproteobacteria bacterium]|nr:hypothetical protein [Deltaproteobacteria bacterium]
MARRWAIGVGLGGFAVAPAGAPDGAETEFRMAELAVRFRATRRFELFLAFSGGRQVLENDEDGELATDLVTLGARFRFMPGQRWNWFLMAGFGSTLIAHHQTPAEQRDELRRPHTMLGVGLERRWDRFALQAEARMLSVGESETMSTIEPDVGPGYDPGYGSAMATDELSGGQLTLGASIYF